MESLDNFLIEDLWIRCSCQAPSHVMVFRLFSDEDYTEVYVDYCMNPIWGFFKRVWLAIKYVLKISDTSGHFNEICLSTEDADKLISHLSKYLLLAKKHSRNP